MGTNGLSHSRWLDLPGGRPFRAGRSHDLARDAGPERSVRSARYPGSTVLSRGKDMKVSEVMTRQVEVAAPDDTLQKAAGRMAELDTGVLPVGEGDRLVGMLTDRDIAVRAVAQGKGPDARVRDAMTPAVKYCFEDEDLNDVVHTMAEQKVRRLPVMSREKRLVGIVSLGDVAIYADSKQTDAAVSAVSEPGGPHTQPG